MTARLIAVRGALGCRARSSSAPRRHTTPTATSCLPQADLLADLRRAYPPSTNATVELGIAANVTTFTASDFGRTSPATAAASTTAGQPQL